MWYPWKPTECSSCEVFGQRKAWVAKDKEAPKDQDIQAEIIRVRHSRTRM